jgi:glucose/arabinose dehydrogenase
VLALAILGCGGGEGASGHAATPVRTAAEHSGAPARAAVTGIRLVKVGRFDSPLYVTAPRGDRRRVFVVEQGGRILVIRGGHRLARPFLDLTGDVRAGGEQGLLSMAFAPDYDRSGLFYVDFTDKNGDSDVQEFHRASADVADPGSRREILFQKQPEANHNGGQLQFGPDGLLYIGFGDGGGAGDRHGRIGNAQDLGTWLGKILRIDPHAGGGRPFQVPAGNPFVGRPGARPEIYAWGLRNPWRFSFDRRTGALSIADVGQDTVEEVDYRRKGQAAGVNFGWRAFEGRDRFDPGLDAPGAVAPLIQHTHRAGWCSITGGYVLRDPALGRFAGRYVYGDFCLGKLYTARLSQGGARGDGRLGPSVKSLSSFGEDAAGRVYATSLAGPVYRLAARR